MTVFYSYKSRFGGLWTVTITDISAVTAFAISSFAVGTAISIAILIIGCLKFRATRIDRGVFFTFSFIVEAHLFEHDLQIL
jgi:hypothetical protein